MRKVTLVLAAGVALAACGSDGGDSNSKPTKGLQGLRKLLAEAAESGTEAPETKLGFVENGAILPPAGRHPLDAAHRGALPRLSACRAH